jgi:hypothetical protein
MRHAPPVGTGGGVRAEEGSGREQAACFSEGDPHADHASQPLQLRLRHHHRERRRHVHCQCHTLPHGTARAVGRPAGADQVRQHRRRGTRRMRQPVAQGCRDGSAVMSTRPGRGCHQIAHQEVQRQRCLPQVHGMHGREQCAQVRPCPDPRLTQMLQGALRQGALACTHRRRPYRFDQPRREGTVRGPYHRYGVVRARHFELVQALVILRHARVPSVHGGGAAVSARGAARVRPAACSSSSGGIGGTSRRASAASSSSSSCSCSSSDEDDDDDDDAA